MAYVSWELEYAADTMSSVMSPSGKLVAYSHPYLITDVKAEAVIVAMAWKNTANKHRSSQSPSQSPLQSLTIETSEYNIMARSIQSDLLLVLVGFRGDGADIGYRISSRTATDGSGEDADEGARLEHDIVALTAHGRASTNVEALTLQRRKLDMLANTIGDEAKVFTVVDDGRQG